MTKLLETITFSKKRENLLILLKDGPKTLDSIRTSLKVTSSGIIPQIRKMEGQNLVQQEGRSYVLTDIGTLIAEVFYPLIKTIDIMEKHKKFWMNHDLKAIPKHLLNRIYELGNCCLIESDISEMYEPHKQFMDALSKSKKIMGISPVFHHSYPPFFLQLAESGVEISLILTRKVFDKTKNEYADSLQKFLDLQTTELYVSDEDIRLASGVTDCFFSISLFFKNGGYDSQRDLISYDHSAIKWGEELFHHFLMSSNKIKKL